MTDPPASPPTAARPGAAWAAAGAWAAGIFAVSSFPLRTPTASFEGSDKVAHLVLYAVLGLLLARALHASRPRWGGLAVVAASVVLAVLYGGSDEWHQTFVPHRTAEWGDLAADASGSLAGAVARVLVSGRRRSG